MSQDKELQEQLKKAEKKVAEIQEKIQKKQKEEKEKTDKKIVSVVEKWFGNIPKQRRPEYGMLPEILRAILSQFDDADMVLRHQKAGENVGFDGKGTESAEDI